jgi:DNA-binding transcriptional regulator YbjK
VPESRTPQRTRTPARGHDRRRGAPEPGRPRPGEERRLLILEAAVRLLAVEGHAGLTHRRIAREAGVPLAATTYYFKSKDDLLQEALRLVAAREMQLLEARAADLARSFSSPGALGSALASVLLDRLSEERAATVAKFEAYLEAARRPSLRPTSEHWIAGFVRLAEAALAAAGAERPRSKAELLVAGADGLLLQHLATAGPGDDREALRRRLKALVSALL